MSQATNPYRGMIATRYLKSLAVAKGSNLEAIAYTAGQNWRGTPEVELSLKAPTGPVNTTTGAGLVPTAAGSDFYAFVHPLTVIGRLSGFARVPFNTRVLTQTAPTAAGWVGEGQAKPVTHSDFDGETLPARTVAALAVITQELSRSSAPSAESVLSNDLARAAVAAIDAAFIDPSNAGVPGVKPPSVTNGVTPIPSTGATLAAIDVDLKAAVSALDAAGSDLAMATWIMRPRSAVHLAGLRGTGGVLAFPFVNAKGGTLMGLPVITSNNVPITGGMTSITLLNPTGIAYADDGEAEIGVSAEAAIQMLDNPVSSAAQQVSLWQLNLVCLRMVRRVNWKLLRPGFVQVITGVAY